MAMFVNYKFKYGIKLFLLCLLVSPLCDIDNHVLNYMNRVHAYYEGKIILSLAF